MYSTRATNAPMMNKVQRQRFQQNPKACFMASSSLSALFAKRDNPTLSAIVRKRAKIPPVLLFAICVCICSDLGSMFYKNETCRRWRQYLCEWDNSVYLTITV